MSSTDLRSLLRSFFLLLLLREREATDYGCCSEENNADRENGKSHVGKVLAVEGKKERREREASFDLVRLSEEAVSSRCF